MILLKITSGLLEINNETEAWITMFGLIFLGFVFTVMVYVILDFCGLIDKGYMQGQIDALNGKIEYKKTENKDKELIWTKVKLKQTK